ncbi:hypothetical protein R3W88_011541 [Solanum pinnatisectum]|uniref:Uncharacterized protein n=1 Tax=Solanum pinnatisectum TaxID=50273 RepID=A0AAV9L719_9SOLN|nr:hypothetical protein R3W88_011541 [Solanum pinnatisectum]
MGLISETVNTFIAPTNIPNDIRKLQQLLPLLAIQDRMLKRRINNYTLSANKTRREGKIVTICYALKCHDPRGPPSRNTAYSTPKGV